MWNVWHNFDPCGVDNSVTPHSPSLSLSLRWTFARTTLIELIQFVIVSRFVCFDSSRRSIALETPNQIIRGAHVLLHFVIAKQQWQLQQSCTKSERNSRSPSSYLFSLMRSPRVCSHMNSLSRRLVLAVSNRCRRPVLGNVTCATQIRVFRENI